MPDHYFDASPSAPDRRQDVSARIWGKELTFTTSSGVSGTEVCWTVPHALGR